MRASNLKSKIGVGGEKSGSNQSVGSHDAISRAHKPAARLTVPVRPKVAAPAKRFLRRQCGNRAEMHSYDGSMEMPTRTVPCDTSAVILQPQNRTMLWVDPFTHCIITVGCRMTDHGDLWILRKRSAWR
jgi:hypothetical protein